LPHAIRRAHDIGWNQWIELGGGGLAAGRRREIHRDHLGRLHKGPDRQPMAERSELQGLAAWMKKYNPDADIADRFNVYGYSAAQTLVQMLQQCGDDLTWENVMRLG
jgi:hypothetical protein